MLEKIIDWSIRNKFMVVLEPIFVVVGGVYALKNIPLDAIPDLSDVQVIVYTEYPGQAPQVVEDQVTYPLTTKMLSVPGSKVVDTFLIDFQLIGDPVRELLRTITGEPAVP